MARVRCVRAHLTTPISQHASTAHSTHASGAPAAFLKRDNEQPARPGPPSLARGLALLNPYCTTVLTQI